MICIKNLKFSGRPGAKDGCQRPPGSARAQPWNHCSKFSNLSNWKEEAWRKSGLQRDSNPWPPRCRCVALPTDRAMKPHIGSEVNLLSSYLPWGVKWRSFFTFIYNRSSKMNYFIYFTSFHSSRDYELNKLTSLPMCGFIAQLVEQRTGNAEVTGSNPVEALIFFFQASSFQLLKLENLLRWSFFTFSINIDHMPNYLLRTFFPTTYLSRNSCILWKYLMH